MNIDSLYQQIKVKESFLCVGLDVDLNKIPPHLLNEKDPIFSFSKGIIDATHSFTVAYKPNLAFFEAYGLKGWKAFEKTIDYLNKNYPNHFIIADAKRGDIGNTSGRYAKAFFENFGVDAVTISPYMGRDSIEPFLSYKDKYAVLLALTSNKGSRDFQFSEDKGVPLYEKVLRLSTKFKNSNKLMYVVGATKSENLIAIRKIVPDSFLLIPGVGAQGGNLKEVVQNGINSNCGLLVNSSRGIIYASSGTDFSTKAAAKAFNLQKEMSEYLKQFKII
ncbi:MAG: orotidine-5'-phosphate decarboxylase [Bacteroidota bacterium]|nr:orotidine-5'-phosphate decarboxylase [Bacteroidota bacterium]